MKKNQTKLYNVIMPIWLLVIFPFTWIIILPLNYLIDTLVLRLTMKHLNIENRKEIPVRLRRVDFLPFFL